MLEDFNIAPGRAQGEAPRIGRLRAAICGAVQGVGFRPHIHRIATRLGLRGWVTNSSTGVLLEVEGEPAVLIEFLNQIESNRPPQASIHSLETTWLDPAGYRTFEIRPSTHTGELRAIILPDIATCPECLRELFDPTNRRFQYPFTNCAHCGPRFSIVQALPYDRKNTTMAGFRMCPECEREYHDPADRRFHAQPNACPACGPQIRFLDAAGQEIAGTQNGLSSCARAILSGLIVAVKGIGGFHLMVDARNEEAVHRLRILKHREEKPFALLFPSMTSILEACHVTDPEARLLASAQAPIVLLSRREQTSLATSVAPHNSYYGAMLPSSPLHYLLMAEIGDPVVATSGNLSDEPICTDNMEALRRLRGIADAFLIHDRPIARPIDDSVARVMLGRELVLRRSRGYAPMPLTVRMTARTRPLLAMGAHLKNTVALALDTNVFVSQHIGDLETEESFTAFRQVINDFETMYRSPAGEVVADAHPDYVSTRYAIDRKLPLTLVQHHFAHVMACMAENEIEAPVLGVAWDGTGYGPDGTIWGGEFLAVDEFGFERLASLLPFFLPGGDAAAREPRRAAIGLLFTMEGEAAVNRRELASARAFAHAELELIAQMLARRVNAPKTSSAGRLFDGVASLLGIRQRSAYEGQAAMELEFAASSSNTEKAYPFEVIPAREAPENQAQARWHIDWRPMLVELLSDSASGEPPSEIAAKFHNTLASMIVAVAERSCLRRVALSGGCFQNRELVERTNKLLESSGFHPYWHQRVPPNDGGIALGQVYAASRRK